MKKLCSIIVRTKNEERWISSCIKAIHDQDHDNYEIVIVDNNSTDKTIEKSKQLKVDEIVKIKDYLPGKALNEGIRVSKGDYIVCLSSHCIPTDNKWLSNLVNAIEENENYAGVYGRQEPMSFSSPSDKRDLLLVFGLDRKIQEKDSFFHNANSIIKKELLDKYPFDNNATNIEDRIWAKEMLKMGYKILYEPLASVYHYHGIHQDGDLERLDGVSSIIQSIEGDKKTGTIKAKDLNIIAMIPISRIRNKDSKYDWVFNGNQQYYYPIKAALSSKYISDVFVSTDSKEVQDNAIKLGAKSPFIRPKYLSGEYISNEKVQQYSLEQIENKGILPDLVVHMEETYPFCEQAIIDGMIEQLIHLGYDSIIAVKRETGFIWQEDINGNYKRLDRGDIPRKIKEKSFIGLSGLCCVTHPEFIRKERLLGDKIGLYTVENYHSTFEVRDNKSNKIAQAIVHNNKILKN